VSTYVDIDLPPDAVLMRTSGVCSVCDDRFVDQLAYEVRAPDRPDGYALIESRHVHPLAFRLLNPTQARNQ
jgi:hypothetical protein